jgi:hypothetical protein
MGSVPPASLLGQDTACDGENLDLGRAAAELNATYILVGRFPASWSLAIGILVVDLLLGPSF